MINKADIRHLFPDLTEEGIQAILANAKIIDLTDIEAILKDIFNSLYNPNDIFDDAINNLFNDFIDISYEFTFEDPSRVIVSSGEKSLLLSNFNGWCITRLQNYLEKFEPTVSFSFAKWDRMNGRIILYFKSDPESFSAFTRKIHLSHVKPDMDRIDVKLALDDREQEHPHNNISDDGER